MTRLEVWLRFRGVEVEENLWELPLLKRTIELVEIWDGPYVIPEKGPKQKKIVLDYNFDGELVYDSEFSIESVFDEMNILVNSRKRLDTLTTNSDKNIRQLVRWWINDAKSAEELNFIAMNF